MVYNIYDGGPLHGRWDKDESPEVRYHHPMTGPDGLVRFTYDMTSAHIYTDFTTRLWTMTPESTTRWHEQKERLM